MRERSPHFPAVLQALFVTFLWSTSWVLIKIGLKDVPALTFAGLRYGLAFACLLPFFARPARLAALRTLGRGDWLRLALLGVLFYALTQGAQFVGLAYLPAVTVTLLLNFTPVVVALLGMVLLAERPGAWQWAGMVLGLAGAFVFFYPVSVPVEQMTGLLVVVIGLLANAASSLLGRRVNRAGSVDPLAVTLVSMGIGAAVLLAAGLMVQGLPQLSLANWAIVAWLALVNTAFAFTLWNHTLRTLSAMESSVINNTMLIQITLLAWLFLGEGISLQQAIALVMAGTGTLIVQLARTRA